MMLGVLLFCVMSLAGCRVAMKDDLFYGAVGDQKLEDVSVSIVDPNGHIVEIFSLGKQESKGESPVLLEFFKTVQALAPYGAGMTP